MWWIIGIVIAFLIFWVSAVVEDTKHLKNEIDELRSRIEDLEDKNKRKNSYE